MEELKSLLQDEAVAAEFFSKETPEAAQAFLKEKGVEMSIADIQELGKALEAATSEELSEDALENVAGGGAIRDAFDDIVSIANTLVKKSTWTSVANWFRRW